MNRALQVLLPLGLVALGALGAVAMIKSRSKPEVREFAVHVPLVRVLSVELRDVQLIVTSQGTVSPRTESTLLGEVAGRVTWVAPSFASGGFFEESDVLLKIDSADYRQAVVQARAAVAQAELRLAREQAEADVARDEWSDLGQGTPTSLTLREPQLADAAAALAAARAGLDQTERNLERTEIRAPYAGRIRRKQVDVGQYVTPGTPLVTIYAVDSAEIRLPLPDDELAFVDLPLGYRGESDRPSGPRVVLRARFAGRTHEWKGQIVRTEGEIDPRSRMIHAVVRVADPYARGGDPERPPLAVGLYVDAEILGRVARQVAVVPRSALRGENQVLVVSDEDRLHFRTVEILRTTHDEVIVSSGLEAGERICLSQLAAVTEGMRVRTAAETS